MKPPVPVRNRGGEFRLDRHILSTFLTPLMRVRYCHETKTMTVPLMCPQSSRAFSMHPPKLKYSPLLLSYHYLSEFCFGALFLNCVLFWL